MLSMILEINPFIIGTFACLCVVFIYRYMRDTYSVVQKLGIPCPKPIWVFGNVHEMRDKNPLTVFQEWRKQYGDIYGFYEGFRAGVVVHGHEMAQEILSKNFDSFIIRSSYRPFQYYHGDKMLINIKGEHWRNQRAVINKTLNHSGLMKELVKKAQTVFEDMAQSMEQERQLSPDGIDIKPMVQKFTARSMMTFLLDMGEDDIRCHGDALYEYELESNLSASADNQIGGLAKLFPTLVPLLKLGDRRHRECLEKVVSILQKYLANTVKEQNNNDMKHTEHSSILSHLISSTVQSRDIDGSLTRRKLTNEELLAHVLALLSETYVTTSASSMFMLYELARHPTVQEKLFEEICQVCGKYDDIQMSSLNSMEYFDMVFNEAYRMHPVAPGLSRVCSADCNVRGIPFKKGMTVRVMTDTMYNDPTLYPNPEQFNPERFHKQSRQERPVYSFMPFGMGPRMCPGQKIGMIIVKMTIISVLTRYKLEVTDQTEIPLKHALRPSIVPANCVHMRLMPRA